MEFAVSHATLMTNCELKRFGDELLLIERYNQQSNFSL